MTSPRIALILAAFPVLSETFIVRQWLGLLHRGWDVHVACAHLDAAVWDTMEPLADRPDLKRRVHVAGPTLSTTAALRRLPATALRLARRPRATAGHWRRNPSPSLRRLYLDSNLIHLEPDLIHFEFGSLAPERMDLGRLLGSRVVVSFRGFDLAFAGLDREDFYRPVWDLADRLHFLGRDLRRRAITRGCPEDAPHELIPPAVDTERFRPPPEPAPLAGDEPIRILSVGRLAWKKGYDYGLRAVRRLVAEGVPCTYTLVGDGPEMEAIAYARHQLGLEDQVRLTGALDHGRVLEAMGTAHIFLHPAVSEGFCNAVLEAQAMALPVVTTDADGLAENVADGETGFVVPRRDPDALAVPLKRLARDPHLRRRMGQAGRRRVRRHFRPDQELDGFEKLYRGALQAPPRRGRTTP